MPIIPTPCFHIAFPQKSTTNLDEDRAHRAACSGLLADADRAHLASARVRVLTQWRALVKRRTRLRCAAEGVVALRVRVHGAHVLAEGRMRAALRQPPQARRSTT